jgi:hypothetical protein
MYADDLVSTHELRAAEAAAQQAKSELPLPPGFGSGIGGIVPDAAPVWAAVAACAFVEGPRGFQSVPILVLEAVRCESSTKLQQPVSAEWAMEVASVEWAAQANLVRDVFGTPFRPFTLNPIWLNPTVRGITESLYYDQDFDPLPILADALEDAGCADDAILNHLRSPGPHVRGCWAVDLILGKS